MAERIRFKPYCVFLLLWITLIYFLTPLVGVGLTLRHVSGAVQFPQGTGSIGLDAGGFQIGFGARIRLR